MRWLSLAHKSWNWGLIRLSPTTLIQRLRTRARVQAVLPGDYRRFCWQIRVDEEVVEYQLHTIMCRSICHAPLPISAAAVRGHGCYCLLSSWGINLALSAFQCWLGENPALHTRHQQSGANAGAPVRTTALWRVSSRRVENCSHTPVRAQLEATGWDAAVPVLHQSVTVSLAPWGCLQLVKIRTPPGLLSI